MTVRTQLFPPVCTKTNRVAVSSLIWWGKNWLPGERVVSVVPLRVYVQLPPTGAPFSVWVRLPSAPNVIVELVNVWVRSVPGLVR